jgi:hypothetical protein
LAVDEFSAGFCSLCFGCSLDLEFVVFAGCVNKGERMRVNVSKNEET